MMEVFMVGMNIFMVLFSIAILPIMIKDLVETFIEDKNIGTRILVVFLIAFLLFIIVFYFLFVFFGIL